MYPNLTQSGATCRPSLSDRSPVEGPANHRIFLLFKPTRAIHVSSRNRRAKETKMNPTITEETAASAETPASMPPKPRKKAARAPRRAPLAPAKGKAEKKAKDAKKGPRGAKRPASRAKSGIARDGSKAATILELLNRPGGATAQELQRATGWQPHSVRGFLSGTLRKKKGLHVISTKGDNGQRSYSIEG
jgi:hypothetical protein